ncbi:hypothetical protein GW17_00030374 [Ensete ventricosum]|nr:hypothetical protein GW17_00030374 [Ensete ventricosum]
MRAGGCAVQQALTPEAAAVVKQAINLARRRGHAQVTPLHVANAMLSSSTGLLRAACLRSHSHPLQCKALELCFNDSATHLTIPQKTKTRSLLQVKNEDVMSVVDTLVSGRRSRIVIVGECLATAEAVVGGVMDKVDKKEVPEGLRNVQFLTLPLLSFKQMPLEEVDQKIGEMRCFVKSCCMERGVVLYLKDLNWAAESRIGRGEKGRTYYCPLEHVIMEIRNLICGGFEGANSNERLCLVSAATYQTYMRCRIGNPSLETLWGLQPLQIPAGGFRLSLNFSPSSASIYTYSHHIPSLHQSHQPWTLSLGAKHPSGGHLLASEAVDEEPEHNSRINDRENAGQTLPILPCVYPQSNPNSNSSSGTMEMEFLSRFKALNAQNLKALCNALERKVSWQQDIIPEIASTILQCRSGLIRRKDKWKPSERKEETWLFFQGSDTAGKERIARELARIVFGSYTNLITVGLGNLSSTRSDSTEDLRNKRSRAEASRSYLDCLFEALRENPHRVIMMEDIEQVDHYTLASIKRAMEGGRLQSYGGEEVGLSDAIIILSCESFDSRSRVCSPLVKQKAEAEDEMQEASEDVDTCLSIDLNVCAAGDTDLGDCTFDNAGLIESVDRAFFFKLPEEI